MCDGVHMEMRRQLEGVGGLYGFCGLKATVFFLNQVNFFNQTLYNINEDPKTYLCA